MTLEQFIEDFIEEVRNDSIIQGITPSQMFLENMIERLENMEYIFNSTPMHFYKLGTNKRIMKFDMYAFDDIDKSLVLLANEYIDDTEISTLTQTDINQITTRMLNFVDETYKGTIYKFLDPSQDIYQLATELQQQLTIDFVDANNDVSIEKIKLFIITNKKLSKRVSNLKLDDYRDKQVELNVWDIERIFDVINSGKDKEPIVVDFKRYNGSKGITYLKADFGENIDYDAYMCILPGKLLSDIYWEHGSRLLEGNVRAFLSNRGKVNKGIRNTIKQEPSKFFTYNNGIACTAKGITFSDDYTRIDQIEDLQIINGGQTTASLTSAWKKDNSPLENIFVPMKLTIIKSEHYDDMVQKIAKYANSQNKVTDADLFSNHPFHRQIEKLSLNTPAPPQYGETHNTFWYYERSRGKYQNEMFKYSTKAQINAFKKKYPKNQVIVKEDLAKYIMSGEHCRPDLVSKGRAKNMNEFAVIVDKQWGKDRSVFNEKYFNKAICYAIIFKKVDVLVKKAEWYNVGGIKLNIVPYTISKIMSSIPEDKSIDFNRIWKEQDLYPSFIEEIKKVSYDANVFLNASQGVIVTEYAKKESTWKAFKSKHHKLSYEFTNDLINKSIIEGQENSAKKDAKQSQKVNIEIQIAKLAVSEEGKYWDRLLDEGIKRNLLTPTEIGIIKNYICELSKTVPKRIPSAAQYKVAWHVRKNWMMQVFLYKYTLIFTSNSGMIN